jgi:transcriptional regulator GlxA family with amidase domain
MTARLPLHACILAVPDTMASPVLGIYDVLNSLGGLQAFDEAIPAQAPYRAEIVSERRGPMNTGSNIPIQMHRAISEIERTDLVFVPSIVVDASRWETGRFPATVEWLRAMHEGGATICTACSGVFLLAETGLLDGCEATLHWTHARAFERAFPKVKLSLEKILVTAGSRGELVMSGAATSWHDLLLHIVARQVGVAAAQALAKFHVLQWHADGQAPFMVFVPVTDHGDGTVAKTQAWAGKNYSAPNPVEEMARLSGIPERSFKRRFTKATGLTPIEYIQHLRVDQAKRRLERTSTPVDEIGWQIGYENPAFFRRLFKRTTGVSPSHYRRQFRLPVAAGAR